MALQDTVAELQGSGLFELVLPFLLVFALVYGVLESLSLFGDDNSEPNVIIALVIGVFAVVYFDMGGWLAFLEGPWAMWLVLLLMVLITLELVGLDPLPEGETSTISKILGVIAVLGVLALFLMEDQSGTNVLEAIFGSDVGGNLGSLPIIGDILAEVGLVPLLIVVAAAGLVYWMVSGD